MQWLRVALIAVVINIGGSNIPPLSFGYDVEPCTPDPLEPQVRPIAWGEQWFEGVVGRLERLEALAGKRSIGYINIGTRRLRVCLPLTRLFKRGPNGEMSELSYAELQQGGRVEVKYLHYKKTGVNIATVIVVTPGAVKFPNRRMELIVPAPLGASVDIIARAFSHVISKKAGQQTVVVNVPGDGGMEGLGRAGMAAPDGYTLLLGDELIAVGFYTGRGSLNYADFEPICRLTQTPLVVASASAGRWKTFGDLFERARKEPLNLRVGTTRGSRGEFFFALIDKGFERPIWKYQLSEPADLVATAGRGDVDAISVDAGYFLRFGQGTLRPLAVADDKRWPALQGVPTLKEYGVDVTYGINRGLFAPRGTPPSVIGRLEELCAQGAKDEEFSAVANKEGAEVRLAGREGLEWFLKRSDETHREAAVRLGY